MRRELVIGVDAGGTSTRCVIADTGGTVLARGRGGGANQHSGIDPAHAFTDALRAALAHVRPELVAGGVFGVAGATTAGLRATSGTVRRVWAECGLPGVPYVTNDIVVAFAAGSAAPAGAVLIAGTGAVAARVCDGRVARRCDGYGWLLGDEGSAVWLAVAALRATLAAFDGRGPRTALLESLAAELGVPSSEPQPILRAVYSRSPAELGRLAPAVSRAASDGDEVAAGIVAEAAERLLAGLAAVAPEPGEPVVLSGAVLRSGPVADAVRAGLRERFDTPVNSVVDGALGAAGLALRRLGAPAAAHAGLLNAAEPAQI